MVNSINEATGRETYWLYHSQTNEPLTAVRLPPGASNYEVRWAAIDQHERVPLQPAAYTPFEWSILLQWHSTVKQFPGKN